VPQASGVGEGINMEMEVQEILHLICYAPTKVFVPEGMPIVHAQCRLYRFALVGVLYRFVVTNHFLRFNQLCE